jgi:twinkle protein
MSARTWADYGIDLPPGARGEIDVLCPKCSAGRRKSRDKCLSLNVEKGTWQCHHPHCGWKGGLGVSENEYGSRPTAIFALPKALPAEKPPTVWENTLAWFETRGISEAVVVRNGITAVEEFCPACEKEVGTILFPFRRDGVHINTKHRCGRKHMRQEKGAERILYGLDDITADDDTLIIVEGEIDKLSLEMAGYLNVLSVPDGAPSVNAQSYNSKFDFLVSEEPLIKRVTQIILAGDADEPGEKLNDELGRRIGPEKCSRVTWPLGIKDANDALVNVGAEFLRDCIERAEPFPVEGIFTFDETWGERETLYDNGYDHGVTTGYVKFDQHYRARAGLFTVVTGISSHGKSHFLDQLMVKLALRHDWSFGICSPENQPITRHQAGILSTYMGKPFTEGPTPRMSKAEMHEASSWANNHFAFILPESPTLDAILDLAKVMVYRRGINGLVIDPWNEIEHLYGKQSETLYISECLSKIRRFARYHNIQIWLVAHPSKMTPNEDGSERVPGLYDISGSAHFRNKADSGITVWRDLSPNSVSPVQVHIRKIRFEETGQLGMVEFTYDNVTGQYYEVSGVTT